MTFTPQICGHKLRAAEFPFDEADGVVAVVCVYLADSGERWPLIVGKSLIKLADAVGA